MSWLTFLSALSRIILIRRDASRGRVTSSRPIENPLSVMSLTSSLPIESMKILAVVVPFSLIIRWNNESGSPAPKAFSSITPKVMLPSLMTTYESYSQSSFLHVVHFRHTLALKEMLMPSGMNMLNICFPVHRGTGFFIAGGVSLPS